MRNVSDKFVDKINTHILYSITLENRAVYETMSKNVLKLEGTQTIWCLSVAYWIGKPTRAQAHTHTHTHRNV